MIFQEKIRQVETSIDLSSKPSGVYILSVFNTEKLEKMSLHKLAALYAFWTNRFVKVVLVMYKSYIIMYELAGGQ